AGVRPVGGDGPLRRGGLMGVQHDPSACKPERKLARAAPEVPRVRWVIQTRLGGEDFDPLPFRPEYVGLDLLQVSPVHNRAAIGPGNLEHGIGRSVLWLRAEPVPTDGHLIRAYIQFDAERSVAPSEWAASTWRGKPNAPWLIGNVHPCPSMSTHLSQSQRTGLPMRAQPLPEPVRFQYTGDGPPDRPPHKP